MLHGKLGPNHICVSMNASTITLHVITIDAINFNDLEYEYYDINLMSWPFLWLRSLSVYQVSI